MILLTQMIGACGAIALLAALSTFLPGQSPNSVPWMLYAIVAALGGWGLSWLYARWRYGKGVKVTFSRRVD